ncbi:Citrate synthase [Mycena sanguinolenta]|uniref:Citrate synthase n=1 Tax=Mycena sanguinolenta TaxID=230812 RepID=A0A8H6ZC75_9AGAR|nr:Citrate synthase [Mycena sanguinolenta]
MVKPDAAVNPNTLSVRDNRTGKTYSIPIVDNSIAATDFKAIKAPRSPGDRDENETEKGLRVADKGFLNTAVLRSEITYIDGDAGVLRYRLATMLRSKFPLTATYFRTNAEGTPSNNSRFTRIIWRPIKYSIPTHLRISAHEIPVSSVARRDNAPLCDPRRTQSNSSGVSGNYDAHPMAILTSALAYLGSYYSEANPSLQGQNLFTRGDAASLAVMDKQIYRLIGKATTLAAMAYRVRQGREFVTPPTGLSYTGSLARLWSIRIPPSRRVVPHYMGHCMVILFISLSTAINSHAGGANEAVIRMLISIGKPENVPAFLEAVKKRDRRVYKTSDPRSFIVRKTADEVFKITGKDELLETAMALHDAAMKDDYFISRKLAPNVDFCGLIYRAMGFPNDYFPVLFAVPRVVGWLAHWRQMMLQTGGVKIWRPRQIYVGAEKRDYVDVEDRIAIEGPKKTPSAVEHSGQDFKAHEAGVIQRAVPGQIVGIQGGCYVTINTSPGYRLSSSLDLFLFLSTPSPPPGEIPPPRPRHSLPAINMFATLVSVALLASSALTGVLADDFNVGTPTLTQCEKTTISWDSNQGAVNAILVSPSDPCRRYHASTFLQGSRNMQLNGSVFDSHDFGDFTNNSFSWTVNYPEGTQLQLSLENQDGGEAWSGSMTVGKSNVTSCLPASSSSAAASASHTASSTKAASTTPLATVGAAGAAVTSGSTTSDDGTPLGAASGGSSGAPGLHMNPFMVVCALFAVAVAL